MSDLRISVIITTLNREADIGLTLDRLAEQSLGADRFEVLVVDGGSTDRTEDVVNERANLHARHSFRFLVELEAGVTAARHLGAKEARGDLLVYIEDDARAEPKALAAILECFEDPEVHLVGGRCIPDYDSEPPAWIEKFFDRTPEGFSCGSLSLIDQGDRLQETSPHNIWALNFSIRKQTLNDLDGFHPDLMPPGFKEFQGDGESGVSNKLIERKLKAVYHPDVTIHHRIQADRFSGEYFEKRFRFQGICDSYTALRAGGSLQDEAASIVPSRKAKVLSLLRNPLRAPGMVLRKLRKILFFITGASAASANSEGERYYQQALAAYRAGFEFHRRAVETNPALLDWIRRKNYFDVRVADYADERGN
ncbi:MAG: glycosyltransferase [Leptospirales bacterium]|jgi:glycosyltransferase involved in cell wall biosynthesis